jgi:3-oxoacyl-[acyl-carrier protein] reductase
MYNTGVDLKDKTILVTGSSSGIGQAIAIAAAKKGAKVIVHYRKNKTGAEETLKEVNKYSSGQIVQADLTIDSEVEKMFKDMLKLDILVNCAGDSVEGKINNIELWKSQLDNILLSMVKVTNYFLKFEQNGLRKILNISSMYGSGEIGMEEYAQYSAAKAAVNSYTCTLAKKFATNILVNAVAPGYTWTKAWGNMDVTEKKKYEDLTRIGRFVRVEEIAKMVIAILENDAITGEIIRVDGGTHLQKTL